MTIEVNIYNLSQYYTKTVGSENYLLQ